MHKDKNAAPAQWSMSVLTLFDTESICVTIDTEGEGWEIPLRLLVVEAGVFVTGRGGTVYKQRFDRDGGAYFHALFPQEEAAKGHREIQRALQADFEFVDVEVETETFASPDDIPPLEVEHKEKVDVEVSWLSEDNLYLRVVSEGEPDVGWIIRAMTRK